MQRLNFGKFLVAPKSPAGDPETPHHEATLFVAGDDPFGILELATHVLLHSGWVIRDILQVCLDVNGNEAEFAPYAPLIKEARVEGFAFEVVASPAEVPVNAESPPPRL